MRIHTSIGQQRQAGALRGDHWQCRQHGLASTGNQNHERRSPTAESPGRNLRGPDHRLLAQDRGAGGHACREAAEIASGCHAAEEACDAIYERMDELFDRVLELRPPTLEGYQAMASAAINQAQHDDWSIAAMLSSLTGVQIQG